MPPKANPAQVQGPQPFPQPNPPPPSPKSFSSWSGSARSRGKSVPRNWLEMNVCWRGAHQQTLERGPTRWLGRRSGDCKAQMYLASFLLVLHPAAQPPFAEDPWATFCVAKSSCCIIKCDIAHFFVVFFGQHFGYWDCVHCGHSFSSCGTVETQFNKAVKKSAAL